MGEAMPSGEVQVLNTDGDPWASVKRHLCWRGGAQTAVRCTEHGSWGDDACRTKVGKYLWFGDAYG